MPTVACKRIEDIFKQHLEYPWPNQNSDQDTARQDCYTHLVSGFQYHRADWSFWKGTRLVGVEEEEG